MGERRQTRWFLVGLGVLVVLGGWSGVWNSFPGLWVLVPIAVLALLAVVATALGNGYGPALLGFGFAGWAALILLSGLGEPFPLFGVLYAAAALAEFLAAYEFWRWHDHPEARRTAPGTRHPKVESRPPQSLRLSATLIGAGGSVGALVLFLWIVAATISSLGIDAPR